MGIVLDASTALAAVLPDEDSAYARSAVLVAASDALVMPRGATLATNDQQLRGAAQAAGIELFVAAV